MRWRGTRGSDEEEAIVGLAEPFHEQCVVEMVGSARENALPRES